MGFFPPLCKDYCAPTTGFSACDKESIRMQYGCDKDAVRKQWLLKESKKIWDSWKELPKDLFQTDADHISARHRPRSSAILSDKLSWVQKKPSFLVYGDDIMAEVKEGGSWALQESDKVGGGVSAFASLHHHFLSLLYSMCTLAFSIGCKQAAKRILSSFGLIISLRIVKAFEKEENSLQGYVNIKIASFSNVANKWKFFFKHIAKKCKTNFDIFLFFCKFVKWRKQLFSANLLK